MPILRYSILILCIICQCGRAAEPPLFESHCIDCHDEDNAKADFRLDTILYDLNFERDFLKWEDVLLHLVDRSMPPRKREKRPSEGDYESTIDWLRDRLTVAELARAEKKPNWMRRLNRAEYDNTIRDLLGINGLRTSEKFPADDALHGFDNVAEGLNVSSLHLENYLEAAYGVLDQAILLGPQPEKREVVYARTQFRKEKGIHPIKAKSGNMWFNKFWIGNAFHIEHDLKDPGRYRFTISGTPRQFEGGIAGFIVTIDGREPEYLDVKPRDDQPFVIADFTSDLRNPGKVTMQIRWTENQNGLGEKRPGESEGQSPFRQLQAAKKKYPKGSDEQIVAELGWPVFEDLEVVVEGPLHDQWPPRFTTRLLNSGEGEENTRMILEEFLPRAFRRPVSGEEINHYEKIAKDEMAAGEPWIESLKHALAASLVSPHFLFLMERPPPETPKGAYTLNDFEFATRLSYFLWSSMPDDELLRLASAGRLRDPSVLGGQINRMLADPKATALTDGFGQQWLSVRRIPALMPEPSIYGSRFNHHIHREMAREPEEFFDLIRRENHPITDFLDSSYAMLNGTMARHYGIGGVEGQEFRKVELRDRNRGGLLTQAGFLTLTSEATRTSPVKRGIWVLEHLFHRPPPPPPPNIEPLSAVEDNRVRSMNDQLVTHREDTQCASCHAKIDPWGLALERFDGIGSYREKETVIPPDQVYLDHWKQKPVTFEFPESVEFDDGVEVRSIPEFKDYLLGRKDEFSRGFVEQMMIYALGRELLVRDQPAIDTITGAVAKENYRFHTVIRQIIQSKPFQTR